MNEEAEEGATAKANRRTATGEEEVIIEIIKATNLGAGETRKKIIPKEAGEIEMDRGAIGIREDSEAIGMEMKKELGEIVAIETGDREIGDIEEIGTTIVEGHGRIGGTEMENEVVDEEGAVVASTMTETTIITKAKNKQKLNKRTSQ